MPGFSNSALRLFQRLLLTSPKTPAALTGIQTVLDGNTAVAATEACLAEAAGLGTSFPADTAAFAWQAEQQRRGKNCFGKTLTGRESEGPRGALAVAMGLSMSGTRATTFLSSPDLMSAQDLLVATAGRHIPLVIHLSNRTLAAQAGALGSGHKAYHVSADSGFFVLHATSVQEAVDFTLIARRVAELALLPGLVAMDGEQTALAAQQVQLPHPDLIRRYLGDPNDLITAPTPAQQLLFGDKRRRVPRWHDLDHPVMHGAVQGPDSWALGALAKHPYFNHHLNTILEDAFTQLAAQTRRALGPVSGYHTDNAQIILVAQGSAVETLEAVADHLRQTRKLKIGVLGIRCFRPFPGAQIAEHLQNKHVVAVLERVDTPLATDPPLMRQVRAALERALENGRLGTEVHAGYPALKDKQLPRFRSVVYGLGGQPLRAADIIELTEHLAETTPSPTIRKRGITPRSKEERNLEKIGRGRIFLGTEFARASSLYPKRQVLLDNLRRAYPNITQMGLRSHQPSPDIRPVGALTVAIHNLADHGGKGVSVEAATLLHRLNGGNIRSRPGIVRERWIAGWLDIFTYAPATLKDPGDDLPIDVAVLTAPHRITQPITGLRQGSLLLVISPLDEMELWDSLAPALQQDIQAKQMQLYSVASDVEQQKLPMILGSLLGTLLEVGLLETKTRRVISGYEEGLRHLPEAERTARLEAFKLGLETVQLVELKVEAEILPSPSLPKGEITSVDSKEILPSPSLPKGEIASADSEEIPPSPLTKGIWTDEAPLAVRHLQSGNTYDNLPRFWDQIGVLYRHGETAELIPDPYLATGVIPPLSSTFRDLSSAREMLPVFDPNKCTGCGQCWTRCPDSALGSLVLHPHQLIEAGIKLGKAEALQMIASQLVRRFQSLCRDNQLTYPTLGEFIQAAFAKVQTKLKVPDERKQAITEAVNALTQTIGALPIARTEAFFWEAERYQYDTGELLALVINPDACKACGLCVEACEPGALSALPQTNQQITKTHQQWRLWEQLPDTVGQTIEQARKHPQVGPMPAILLSRHCQLAIAGGDNAEAGSGEKAAVRLALAVLEYQRQPLLNQFRQDIAETLQRLQAKIHQTLAEALPTDDLEALAAGLNAIQPGQTPLASLTEHIETIEQQGLIDAERLRRWVKISRGLLDLEWKLATGEQGLGRSRLSLAIAPGTLTGWAGAWPNNPFQVPVAVDMSGETAQLASGLLEGQLREATEGIALFQQARLELDQPEKADEAPDLDSLHWRDLTAEQQQLCSPLLLLGNDDVLAGKGFSAISRLLGTDLPIKIMILADLDLDLGTANVAGTPMAAAREAKTNPSLLALSQRYAYIVQTSIAETTHFLESVQAAFEFAGPALIYVHAPSPERHGFITNQTFTQASLAVAARVLPLFRYDPNGDGVFGSRISLDSNPEPLEAWAKSAETFISPADWAVHEQRFAPYFSPLQDDDPGPLPIATYLNLTDKERHKKTPFVSFTPVHSRNEAEDNSENEQVQKTLQLKVAPALVAACEECLGRWRTLQELAGLVTPFTASIEAQLKVQLTEVHQAELQALKQDYETRLANQRAEIETEMAARVKARLMGLAGYN